MLFTILYSRRRELIVMMEALKQQDIEQNTVTSLTALRANKQRRASLTKTFNSLMYLDSKTNKFEPSCSYWFGVVLLVMRLFKTTVMVLFTDQATQAAFACCLAQLGIVLQQRIRPYRRASE